jgi:16S rRNA G966 N2-methylase RsmD
VEHAPAALAAIRQNLTQLGLAEQARVETRPVARVLSDVAKRQEPFDLVFLDPPYDAAEDYKATLGTLATEHASLLAPGALVIAEHARRDVLPERFGDLVRTRVLLQGDAALSFYAIPGVIPDGQAEDVAEPE